MGGSCPQPKDGELAETQEENQQSVKIEERHQVVVKNAKRGHKQASKSGPNIWVDGVNIASSPVKENSKEYNASYIKEFKEDLWWIRNCIDYFALRPEYHRDEIVKRLQHIEHLINDLDGPFRKESEHLLLNKIIPLSGFFMRGMGVTDLKIDVYWQLVDNLKKLEAKNERS